MVTREAVLLEVWVEGLPGGMEQISWIAMVERLRRGGRACAGFSGERMVRRRDVS